MFLDDKKNKLKNWLNEIVEKHFSYGKDATEEDKQRTKKCDVGHGSGSFGSSLCSFCCLKHGL